MSWINLENGTEDSKQETKGRAVRENAAIVERKVTMLKTVGKRVVERRDWLQGGLRLQKIKNLLSNLKITTLHLW